LLIAAEDFDERALLPRGFPPKGLWQELIGIDLSKDGDIDSARVWRNLPLQNE
jgi:hypothetical protein